MLCVDMPVVIKGRTGTHKGGIRWRKGLSSLGCYWLSLVGFVKGFNLNLFYTFIYLY